MALVRIQLRRDTADNWTTTNPVLAEGEMGVELDTGRIKVGDGVRSWQSLPYTSGPVPADVAPLDVGQRNAGVSLQYARADHSHAFPASANFTQITAGSATITGNLSVTGNLIGGSHTHTVAQITNWASAVSDAVFSNLVAGSNVTLVRDPQTGKTTISAASGGSSAVTSVAGRTGAVVLTTLDLGNWPSPAGQSGKYLTTDGSLYLWADPYEDGGVATVNNLTGNVTVKAGTNVTMLTNPSTNEITISATTSAGTGDVTSVNSLVGALTIAAATGSGLSVAASGSTITLDATISYDDLADVPADFPPEAHTHTSADVTNFQEAVEDAVDGLLVAGTNVTLTYNDSAGTLTIAAAGASAPTLIAGNAIAIDTDTPGEAEISVDGTLDGGAYEGFALPPDPPFFSLQPQSQLVTFGTATFSARVENAPSPTYLWQKAEAGTTTWLGLTNNSPFSGVTTNTLTISPVSASDNGDQFRLLVTLPDGSTLLSDEAVLSTVAIVITDQPQSADFVEADTLDVEPFLLVIAEGGSPPFSYQWQKWDGSAWANVSGETAYYVDSISGTLGASESERIERWRVRITDSAGAIAFSDEARITIRAGAPTIVLDPTDQTIASGAATFSADYQGKGAVPSWERREPNGEDFKAIGKSGTVTTPVAGTSRSTLVLSGLTGNDNGAEYRLRVSNRSGDDVSESATLGTSGPIISSQPLDVTVVENVQAQFTVAASFGGGALTYQWQEKTTGGNWTNLSGATSATLTLPSNAVTLGRDGSDFRVIVTGGGVNTTSKPARLTVISAPAAGNAVFTTDPANATIEEGGGYPLTAVSTWLASTTHYAAVRVEYDDGKIEYHPLSTGTAWNGTVTRRHTALAHSQYQASLALSRSAWVSVVASTSEPTAISASGSTYTLQPWALAKFDVRNCSATVDTGRPRIGVIAYPITQTLPLACTGSATLNIPEPPYSYVESKQARVTVAPRQAFIGPVPKTGFWNPPTARQFTGACDPTGTHVVACAVETDQRKDGAFGSYLYSGDGGKTWMTRNLPQGFDASKVLYGHGSFYIFGRVAGSQYSRTQATALASSDNGLSFTATGWNFGSVDRMSLAPSLAGSRLYCVVNEIVRAPSRTDRGATRRTVWTKPSSGAWSVAGVFDMPPDPPLAYVGYAFNRWFFYNWWSSNGTSFSTQAAAAGAATYHPVVLANATQNYVLASNGYFASVSGGNATSNFSRVTNGQNGGGPQAGEYIYFGSETPGIGATFFRKGRGDPGVNEQLLGHATYWTGNQAGDWADIQIMSYYFGGAYGADLDMTYYNVTSDPMVDGAIFLPSRIIHLFRYRYAGTPAGGGGSIPGPRR